MRSLLINFKMYDSYSLCRYALLYALLIFFPVPDLAAYADGFCEKLFSIDLNGKQCMGLSFYTAAKSESDCLSACCANPSNCQVYSFCNNSRAECGGGVGCWLGPMTDCTTVQPFWRSKGRGQTPEPPGNMNGEYFIGNPNPNSKIPFSTNYAEKKMEFFEVYSQPIRTRYAEVFWTMSPSIRLPQHIIDRFNDQTIAIVGYETDQGTTAMLPPSTPPATQPKVLS